MLYPSVQDLTNENVNRYMLVIATAKGARYVTQQTSKEVDLNKENDKPVSMEDVNQKSVSIAVDKIHGGKFTILAD